MATTVEVLREYGVAIRANGQKHRPEKVKAQIVTQSLKLGATVNAVAVRALGELFIGMARAGAAIKSLRRRTNHTSFCNVPSLWGVYCGHVAVVGLLCWTQ